MKILLCVVCASLPLFAQEPVRYAVSFPHAAHHEAEVRATFTGVRQPVLEVLISFASARWRSSIPIAHTTARGCRSSRAIRRSRPRRDAAEHRMAARVAVDAAGGEGAASRACGTRFSLSRRATLARFQGVALSPVESPRKLRRPGLADVVM